MDNYCKYEFSVYKWANGNLHSLNQTEQFYRFKFFSNSLRFQDNRYKLSALVLVACTSSYYLRSLSLFNDTSLTDDERLWEEEGARDKRKERAIQTLARATKASVDHFDQLSRKQSDLDKNFKEDNCLVLRKEYVGFFLSTDRGTPCTSTIPLKILFDRFFCENNGRVE